MKIIFKKKNTKNNILDLFHTIILFNNLYPEIKNQRFGTSINKDKIDNLSWLKFLEQKIALFLNSPFIIFIQDRRNKIGDAFAIATLTLIFIKLISIEIIGFYPITTINISLIFILALLGYYFEFMIKVKTFIVKHYYYNQYIMDPFFLSTITFTDKGRGYEDKEEDEFDFLIPPLRDNPKKYHFTQHLFFHFHLSLFYLRLLFLAEPFLYIFIRIFILYLLVFNKLFFFAAILSLIGIFSRILFHMTFWDMKDIKNLYEYLHWEPLWLLKQPDNDNIVLKPTKENAKILFLLSLIGLRSDDGFPQDGLCTWKMITIYINNNLEVKEKYKSNYYKFQALWGKEALENGGTNDRLRYFKPYFHQLLTKREDSIHLYLKNTGANVHPDIYLLESVFDIEDNISTITDEVYDYIPQWLINSKGEFNYLMDGTYNKNQIGFFILSFIFLLFSLGLIETYFLDTPEIYYTFGYVDSFIKMTKSFNFSKRQENVPVQQAIIGKAPINSVKYEDKIPHNRIMGGHPISIGIDPETKNIYVISATTANPYKIHKGEGSTNAYYSEEKQNIISIVDTGQVITPDNPEYFKYLSILDNKNNMSTNQTIAQLLNEGKLSPIGFEDKHQQELMKINIPGYKEWDDKVYKWTTRNSHISPVSSDLFELKRLQNAQAAVRVEQSSNTQDYLIAVCQEIKNKNKDSVIGRVAYDIIENNNNFILPKKASYCKTNNKSLLSTENLELKAKFDANNNLYYASDLKDYSKGYIANVKKLNPLDSTKDSIEGVILPQETFIAENRSKIIAPNIGNNTVYEEGQKKGLPASNNKIIINREKANIISAKREPGKITSIEKAQLKINQEEKKKYKKLNQEKEIRIKNREVEDE